MPDTFEAYIFDLDGTLLNTLPDLVLLTNRALRESGYPERSNEEIQSFVGGGVKMLLRAALPESAPDSAVDTLSNVWQSMFPEHGICLTKEYPGMTEVLRTLKEKGKKLGVLSNKFDGGVQQVIPRFFPGIFDVCHGVDDRILRKPDPAGLLYTIEELGCKLDETVYIGDSTTDIETAHRAKVKIISATWGYKSIEKLRAANPFALVHAPTDILDFA